VKARSKRPRDKKRRLPRREPVEREPPHSEAKEPATAAKDQKSKKPERKWSEKPAFYLSLIIGVIVFGDAIANWYQYRAMKRALELDQWPYIWTERVQLIDPLAANRPVRVNILFKNIGKSPAFHIGFHCQLVFIDTPGKFAEIVRAVFRESRRGALADSASPSVTNVMPPTDQRFITTDPAILLSEGQLKALDSGNATLVVVAGAIYRDVFGTDRETETCRMTTHADRVWGSCGIHNDMH